MLFLYGFEKLLYHFQENILLNDSKNVMWWNYQLKMYNILPSAQLVSYGSGKKNIIQ